MAQLSRASFTPEYHQHAESEGWWLSERDDGYLEIQAHDESGRFMSDEAAREYVADRARAGSYLHQLAMHLDGTHEQFATAH